MVNFVQARDVLKRRLEAVFSSNVFAVQGVPEPKVYQGFPVNEPPFYVAVDEIVDTATTDGAVTMGHAEVNFTIRVWCYARHVDQEVAANTLLAYISFIFDSILADQRLNFTVDNSFPEIETAGTATDSSKRYVAAAAVGIRCSVFSHCPDEILEVVHASNL